MILTGSSKEWHYTTTHNFSQRLNKVRLVSLVMEMERVWNGMVPPSC